jgi:hypothetical protein
MIYLLIVEATDFIQVEICGEQGIGKQTGNVI